MGSFDEYPPAIREILEKVADAGYRDILLDEDAGNRFVFTSMATSTDPTVREIGEQLRDGAIDLGQLARSDYYRGALDAGLEQLSGLEPDRMAADLDAALSRSDDHETTDDHTSDHDRGRDDR